MVELGKFYVNPELFAAEKNENKNIDNMNYKKVHNAYFDQIVKDSRAAGKLVLPKEITKVLDFLGKNKKENSTKNIKTISQIKELMKNNQSNTEDVELG